MMNNDGFIITVNFMTPGEGGLVLGHVHIRHMWSLLNFFKVFFSTPGHKSVNYIYSNNH